MNNGNVAHNFVYSDNGNGSNFESINGTLYSYSSILAIKKNGLIFICDHIANYSSSSQRHALHLNRAIGYNTPQRDNTIISYHDIDDITSVLKDRRDAGVLKEIELATNKIKELLIKQSRARKYDYFDSIQSTINNANKIIKYLGIDKRSSIYKQFVKYSNVEDLKTGYKDLIANYAKEKEAARKKEINAQYKKRYEKIQNFSNMSNEEMKGYSKLELANFDFLKIKEDQLCTSQNLCVDLAAAKTLYKAMEKGKNIIGLKIGYYTILSHSGKSVKIGCHNILKAELKRVLNEN